MRHLHIIKKSAAILISITTASAALTTARADNVESLLFIVDPPGNALMEFLNGAPIGNWYYGGVMDPLFGQKIWTLQGLDGWVHLNPPPPIGPSTPYPEILFGPGTSLFSGSAFIWHSTPFDANQQGALIFAGSTAYFPDTGATVNSGGAQIPVNITVVETATTPDGSTTLLLLTMSTLGLRAIRKRV